MLKNILKRILKSILFLVSLILVYVVVSFVLGSITVNKTYTLKNPKTVYLSTNGVHLDIIIPVKDINKELKNGLEIPPETKYVSFGWGDENFYINTPTWGDLTFKNAFSAMFLKSTTLIHLTRYNSKYSDWVEVELNTDELSKLNSYINNTFKLKSNSKIIAHKGYESNDIFYKAKGSYSIFKTCNSWVNTGFKNAGLKASLWTPFDFLLLNKYK